MRNTPSGMKCVGCEAEPALKDGELTPRGRLDYWLRGAETIYLNLERLTDLDNSIVEKMGRCLKKYEPRLGVSINLSGIRELKSDVELSGLSCSALQLDGLRKLGQTQAASLRELFGRCDPVFLSLNGLEEISPEVAQELGQATIPNLALNGLKRLAPSTARKLVWVPATEEEAQSERWELQRPQSVELKSLIVDDEDLADWIVTMDTFGAEVIFKESKIDWLVPPKQPAKAPGKFLSVPSLKTTRQLH